MDQDDKKKQRGDALKKMQDFFDKSMYASVIANGPGESLRKAQAASSLLMSGGFAELVSKAHSASSLMMPGGFAEQVSKAHSASSLMMPGGFAELVSKAQVASSLMLSGGFAEQLGKAQAASSLMMSGGFAEQISKAQDAITGLRSNNYAELIAKANMAGMGAIYNSSMGFSQGVIGSVLAGSPANNSSAVSMYLNAARDVVKNVNLAGFFGLSTDLGMSKSVRDLSQASEWFDRQKDSALYSYLATVKSEDYLDFLGDVEGLDSEPVMFDVGTWDEVPAAQHEIENEIIDVFKSGGNLRQLSVGARKYWYIFCFYVFFDFMSDASALITVGTWIQSQIAAAPTPLKIRQSLRALSIEQRELMEGQCVTTGEQVILRSSFSSDSAELGRIARGVFLEELDESKDGWVHVLAEIDGEAIEGWVARRYVLVF